MIENSIKMSTSVTDDGKVVQKLDVMGDVTHRIADMAALQFNEGVRKALIGLGWTPPAEQHAGCSGANGG